MREVDDAKTKTARHTETVYALTSSTATAPMLLHASRGHWLVESLHWVRDATMREDDIKPASRSVKRDHPVASRTRRTRLRHRLTKGPVTYPDGSVHTSHYLC